MKKKFIAYLTVMLLAAIGLSSELLAQGKGHTGGLGEVHIQLNYSSADNLAKGIGMTEELAEAIVEYREEEGYFMELEDLLNVPGINKKVYKEINPQVGSEGDLFIVPRPGEELEEEDEDIPLTPSKC